MNLFNYRSDVELVLKKSKITKDSRISERHIEFLIHKYRADFIRDNFNRYRQINPSWVQILWQKNVRSINSSEDPLVQCTGVTFGKVTLPSDVVHLLNNSGIISVLSYSGQKIYGEIPLASVQLLPPDSVEHKLGFFFRIGTHLYVSNPRPIQIHLIAENPMVIPIKQNTYVGSGYLEIGTSYTVIEGNVNHNGQTYYQGNQFTAVNTDYTGNGLVIPSQDSRPMTDHDPYPMDLSMFSQVSMAIWTREYKIEQSEIADIKNDNVDQLLALQKNE